MSQTNFAAEWSFYDNDTGYARYAPSSATRLTDAPEEGVELPADATHAFITVLDGNLSFKVDADIDATAGEGCVLFADTTTKVENQNEFLRKLSFIDVSAATDVRIIYGRRR